MVYTPPMKYTQRELLEMEADDWQVDLNIEIREGRPESDYAGYCRAQIADLKKRQEALDR